VLEVCGRRVGKVEEGYLVIDIERQLEQIRHAVLIDEVSQKMDSLKRGFFWGKDEGDEMGS
jgi:hypothetical protein